MRLQCNRSEVPPYVADGEKTNGFSVPAATMPPRSREAAATGF
jgi:hypothetical protein